MNDPLLIVFLSGGLIAGAVIGWLFAKVRSNASLQVSRMEHAALKSSTEAQLSAWESKWADRNMEWEKMKEQLAVREEELTAAREKWQSSQIDLQSTRKNLEEKTEELVVIKGERDSARKEGDNARQLLALEKARNEALEEKLLKQKGEMERMGERFNTEFENIANKILETKTEKFTELNKNNLASILEPLGKNIAEFKTKVEEVYDKEAKERFSLEAKVKELAELNQLISKEARDLTNALKGEAKTQGRWGEMILENILERSGLTKGREYFMEHELRDDGGNALRSDSEGRKMRPDAVISYPDNRRVIIDSKVSLNAYSRMVACEDREEQKAHAGDHAAAVRNHVVALSTKGYDDYDKSLDFVMMFVPSEPAYNAALQEDGDLWNFAYDRRILLLSPTNLITSLKLIADLWKREYQNRHALEIADRGARLYDKFVGFVENMKGVGDLIERARDRHDEAYKQLYTGRDNLVLQATKLKDLGLKAKKSLPADIVAANSELPAPEEMEDERG